MVIASSPRVLLDFIVLWVTTRGFRDSVSAVCAKDNFVLDPCFHH